MMIWTPRTAAHVSETRRQCANGANVGCVRTLSPRQHLGPGPQCAQSRCDPRGNVKRRERRLSLSSVT